MSKQMSKPQPNNSWFALKWSGSALRRSPLVPRDPPASGRVKFKLVPRDIHASGMVQESCRGGFSLLEVMLATAMLAASALVLSSLLGLGAKYGSRAEARTESLSQAQSLLAEFLAMPGEEGELESERTGQLNSIPPRSFRIRMVEASPTGGESAESASSSTANSMASTSQGATSMSGGAGYGDSSMSTNSAGTSIGNSASAAQPSRLVLVTVEVFESADADTESTQVPLTQLSQLVRVPALEKR